MAEASSFSESHDDLEEQIRKIAERQTSESGPSIEDNQKRWLITGICLQKIVGPALRNHIQPVLQNLYRSLQLSNNIDTQTFSNYLNRYQPTNKALNYEAINRNSAIPKIRGKCDIAKFDYRVLNEVELSKLYLVTSMTHYTGFDDTCDLSALLAIVIHIDKFSHGLQAAATAVRDEIRNPWAHCNFTEWDTSKFQNSFLLLEHLVKELHLLAPDECEILRQLNDWQKTGFHLLKGTIGFECLNELKAESVLLAKYCRKMGIASRENFEKVDSMSNQLQEVNNRVEKVEEQVNTICTKEFLTTNKEHFFLPDKNLNFVGRTQELCELNQHLLKTEGGRVMVISGLGGVGKSTLALEYSWKNRESYPGGVFWVSAEDDDSVLESIRSLMVFVGLKIVEPQKAVKDFLMWLSQNPKRWLLVVDNLDSDKLESKQLDLVLGKWKWVMKGHIIITTRREGINAKETFKAYSHINLCDLTVSESICFMKCRAECASDEYDKEIELLVEQLGRLPLALDQAALHIKFLRCSFSEYLEKFKIRRTKFLRSLPRSYQLHKSDERLSVTTTWLMNFELIKRQSEEEGFGSAATMILGMLALLPSSNVLCEVLNTGLPDIKHITVEGKPNANQNVAELRGALCEDVSKKQVVEILSRFSILDRGKTNELLMHHLTKEIVVENINDERKLLLLECVGRMVNKCLDKYEFTYHNVLTNDNDHLEVQKRKESLDTAYKVLKAVRMRQMYIVLRHTPKREQPRAEFHFGPTPKREQPRPEFHSGPREYHFEPRSTLMQVLLRVLFGGSGACTIL